MDVEAFFFFSGETVEEGRRERSYLHWHYRLDKEKKLAKKTSHQRAVDANSAALQLN